MISIDETKKIAMKVMTDLLIKRISAGSYDSLLREIDAKHEANHIALCENDFSAENYFESEILYDLYEHVNKLAQEETPAFLEEATKCKLESIGLVEQLKAANSEAEYISAMANYEAHNVFIEEWHDAFLNRYERINELEKREFLTGEGMTFGEYLELSGLFTPDEKKIA